MTRSLPSRLKQAAQEQWARKPSNALNLIGDRFGRLVVLDSAPSRRRPSGQRVSYWLCRCDCGKALENCTGQLRSGAAKSCGCLHQEMRSLANRVHGMANKLPEYYVWKAMRRRCSNPNGEDFQYYGARGIVVCERWNRFDLFLADMGYRPSPKHSIDRVDVNGNYEPANCRWATAKEQRANRRDSK